jgi:hypothetical protein
LQLCLTYSSQNPYLSLIPDGHIDIHSHLAVSIGARTVEDGCDLREHFRIGVTEIITTPHVIQHVWDNTPERSFLLKHDNTGTAKKNVNSFPTAAGIMDDQFVRLFNLTIY